MSNYTPSGKPGDGGWMNAKAIRDEFTAIQTAVNSKFDSTVAINMDYVTVASSASTSDIWGALGNVINWTGTATTTGFPNAPQAGAERILICASACSFTAGANMLINGVSSGNTVTCAAGDIVIVLAVSTTQFKLIRFRYDGLPAKTALDNMIILAGSNATPYGSVYTKIRRFAAVQQNTGTAFTYADSANNGGSVTINENGLYLVSANDYNLNTQVTYGVTINTAQVTTDIASVNAVNVVSIASNTGTSGFNYCPAVSFIKCVVGDVLRHHNGSNLGASTATALLCNFQVIKIASM